METKVRTALQTTLSAKFLLSKSRLETLVSLIMAFVSGRTVNLSHAVTHLPGEALWASRYRRVQRFFQFVRLDQDGVARLIIDMLNLHRPVPLALDRTNWRLGSKDINVLVLAVVTRRFRIPLMWSFLTHRGNSDTGQRIALVKRYLALFGADSIQWLLADREFIGDKWMAFLNESNIPFAIRVKEDMTVLLDDGKRVSLRTCLRHRRAKKVVPVIDARLPDSAIAVRLALRRLKSGEWLIVMTNTQSGRAALNAYRKRWGIESLFGDAKTRGFNLEDTRLVDPGKLATLWAILAIAMMWAYRCATRIKGRTTIRRKPHGRREKSWFRVGLDALRGSLATGSEIALHALTTAPTHHPTR